MRPEIWISDLEKTWINQVEQTFGWKGPYWVLNAGYKPDNQLKYYHRWQEVAELFNKELPKVKLVQVGHKEHIHPELKGVLNLIGKTDLREMIRLVWCAHGTVGPISLQMHLSGAFQQPAVVVAGGKEPIRWEMYPNHRYLAVNGAIRCAAWDGCWLGGEKGQCKDLINQVPKCFEMIEPYQIVDAIKSYYEGGIL
jgi:ADP-heptose:LPS heptosyltransferase